MNSPGQGRKPKPKSNVSSIKGERNKNRRNKNAPKSEIIFNPEPPKIMKGREKEIWQELCDELSKAKILSPLDLPMLCLLCKELATYEEADKLLSEIGLVHFLPDGSFCLMPALGIRNKAFEKIMKILPEFGMSPSSRTRIKVIPEKAKTVWDEF